MLNSWSFHRPPSHRGHFAAGKMELNSKVELNVPDWKTMGSWHPTLLISTAGVFKDSLAPHKHGKRLGHQLEHSYPSWRCRLCLLQEGLALCSKNSYSKHGSSRLQEEPLVGRMGLVRRLSLKVLKEGRYGHGTGRDPKQKGLFQPDAVGRNFPRIM